MAINKVLYNDKTLMDLTNDTVTPETLVKGVTAHNKAGDSITGEYDPTAHTHDDLYYEKKAVDEKLRGKANSNHLHSEYSLTTHAHTAAQVGAATLGHKHSADEITSGTLAIVRGGTGGANAADARNKLGITPENINAVKSGGVKGEDGGHKMAMSWASDHVIIGVDNNAAVVHLKDMQDTGWQNATAGTNWVSDGSKPFDTRMRRIGNFVTLKYDLTARINIGAQAESAAKSFLYSIGADKKPNHKMYFSGVTDTGKHYLIWVSGEEVKVFGNNFTAGDRFVGTVNYMV